jgi:hypothetical protein
MILSITLIEGHSVTFTINLPAFQWLISHIHLYFLFYSMRTLNNDTRNCAKPEIIAGRLTSIRNIYLRQELDTISIQIQENYKERLPILHLVSLAAYEQVFNRQVIYQI